MNKLRFILKNGCQFTVICKEAGFKTVDNRLIEFKIDGITYHKPYYLKLSEIVAVIDEGEVDDGGRD